MMHQAIIDLLEKYNLQTSSDYENALKEIIQESALVGLWRSGFYEQAAFYGGTALRIFYGLNRFSEDLDFTLLNKNSTFQLGKYLKAIEEELLSLGFSIEIIKKEKKGKSHIDSAFLKGDTLENIIQIGAPEDIVEMIPNGKISKIKLEVDIDPPDTFLTENKFLLEPIPCSVKIISPDYLFAGKMHALLFRKWKNRVKGRDWYDLIWFVKKEMPLNLLHLQRRIEQSESINKFEMNLEILKKLYLESVDNLNIDNAKRDVIPFIKNSSEIDIWSKQFFIHLAENIKIV
jgi:hypothetical protein